MHLTKLTPERYKRMPWKNGGGMTTEILAEPNPNGDGFLWRISIAEVAMSGPCSDFSDYLRSIMLLEGNGFILKCADAACETTSVAGAGAALMKYATFWKFAPA